MHAALAGTWPTQQLLPILRNALNEAEEALLCVAFTNRKGIHLLEPQLARLASRCRLLVTSAFGGETTETALAVAADLRVQVRVLNPSGGTFHPKLYLTRFDRSGTALVGSANLTSGLVANIETALVVSGLMSEQPIANAWQLGDDLWHHPAAGDWIPGGPSAAEDWFSDVLLGELSHAVPEGSLVHTLSDRKPNKVTEVTKYGVYVDGADEGSRPWPAARASLDGSASVGLFADAR